MRALGRDRSRRSGAGTFGYYLRRPTACQRPALAEGAVRPVLAAFTREGVIAVSSAVFCGLRHGETVSETQSLLSAPTTERPQPHHVSPPRFSVARDAWTRPRTPSRNVASL